MSIVESGNSKRIVTKARLGSLAGAALMSTAVFVAAPSTAKAGAVSFFATGNQSWFNTSNWINVTTSTTGTLPESGAYTTAAVTINANNQTLPATGILFDPANQISNANYVAKVEIANNTGSFYLASANSSGNSLNSALNALTVNSGTLELYSVTVGRDYSAMLTQNAGLVKIDNSLKVGGANSAGDFATTVNGSGTYAYHGGTLIIENGLQIGAGNNAGGLSPTSITTPEEGKFVVYNDQAAGAILCNGDVYFAANTNNAGTTGIVEFHYDNNLTTGLGNVRPIQLNVLNTTNATLTLNNAVDAGGGTGNTLSELNLVVDTAPSYTVVTPPTMYGNIGIVYYQNLGLFAENTIAGAGTFPKIFYATDGVTGYTQGATISSVFGGNTYSWTISYSGLITFSNTATSAYDSTTGISATGGNDIVLLGIDELASLPLPMPEPSSVALLGGVGSLILARRRQKKA
jgi:hypothetical protein